MRIPYNDATPRAKLTTLGALWRPRHRLWELPGAPRAHSTSSTRVVSNTGNILL